MHRLCALAGNPEKSFPVILVAGTNGKGSTCAFLASILRAAGLRVGTTPKPHLRSPLERIQVDGATIPQAAFYRLLTEATPWIEAVHQPNGDCGPVTYFEAMSLLSLLWFARSHVDWAVVEVGLGGRLDATNVLDPRLSVITNIGLDHTERLGPDLASIAAEKAGILRPGVPAVTAADGEGWRVIEERAASLAAPLWRVITSPPPAEIPLREQEILVTTHHVGADGARFDLRTRRAVWEDLYISMVGAHQVENSALAACAANILAGQEPRITSTALRSGLGAAAIPGRLQAIGHDPLLLLDAAHNPDGARVLVAALREIYLGRTGQTGQRDLAAPRLILVVGLSSLHHAEEMSRILAPAADHLIATSATHPRGIAAEITAARLRAHAQTGISVEAVTPVDAAVEAALAAVRPGDVVCITGSIFVLGEVKLD